MESSEGRQRGCQGEGDENRLFIVTQKKPKIISCLPSSPPSRCLSGCHMCPSDGTRGEEEDTKEDFCIILVVNLLGESRVISEWERGIKRGWQ